MTKKWSQFYGIPQPITELTVEQDLNLRLLKDSIEHPATPREDVNTVFLALQKQNYVLANSLTNLLDKWPKPPMRPDPNITGVDPSKSGILFVIKT